MIGKVVSDGRESVYLVANPAPTSRAMHGLLCKVETAGAARCHTVEPWRALALASDGAVYLADSRTVQRFRFP